ncbi:MAG: type II CRISPR-associated endonuclease Cas1 [Opitutales bacterium]|nr:type II CRISPR-associated endonuclease Cas1 [Opitutales bacterium]
MVKRILYFENPVFLSLKYRSLQIRFPEETGLELREAPIEDLGFIVLDNPRITITQALIAALMENKVGVVTCDSVRMPTGLMLPFNGHTLQSKVFRLQAEISLPLKKQLWKQIVCAKIQNQKKILECEGLDFAPLDKIANSIKSGDSENCEGQAAAYYWKTLFPSIPNFVRSREGEPPNNLLNYGYAVLRAIVARAIVSSGLHPTLGIFHRNQYNAYCLADDLMEPYRPFVDKAVLGIIATNQDISGLTKPIKGRLYGISVDDVLMNGIRRPLMAAISQTIAGFVQTLTNGNRKIPLPEVPVYATL